jgi:hypothetical protein
VTLHGRREKREMQREIKGDQGDQRVRIAWRDMVRRMFWNLDG